MALERKSVVIAYTDGRTQRYPYGAKVEVDFERTFKKGLATAPDATGLYQLAWLAERQNGHVVPDFETWVGTVITVDVEKEDIPFVPVAPAGGSPNSPAPPA